MAESIFILPKLAPGQRDSIIAKMAGFLARLPADKAWKISVQEQKRIRTNSQNRYLWGVAYPTILQAGHLEGWDVEDLHEYFLGEHFGWETLEGFGRKRVKPIRRSAKLTTLEFSDYVGFIQRKAAELGIYVPDPNEGTL